MILEINLGKEYLLIKVDQDEPTTSRVAVTKFATKLQHCWAQAHIVYAKHNTVCRKATAFCVRLKTRSFRFAKNDVDLRPLSFHPARL